MKDFTCGSAIYRAVPEVPGGAGCLEQLPKCVGPESLALVQHMLHLLAGRPECREGVVRVAVAEASGTLGMGGAAQQEEKPGLPEGCGRDVVHQLRERQRVRGRSAAAAHGLVGTVER